MELNIVKGLSIETSFNSNWSLCINFSPHNRPDKFGQHSGLGLNIVKNLVDLHNATIKASNRTDQKGAKIEIEFPQV